ncbi:MAG: LTA synthase family protein [Rhodanobacteraceae bacterium]
MIKKTSARPPVRNAILLWAAVALLLFLPAHEGLSTLDVSEAQGFWFDWRNVLATLSLTGLLAASSVLAHRMRKSWVVGTALVVIGLLFVRMLFAGLTRFSGRDFDADFFVHLSPDAVVVAWRQYTYLFVLFALVVVALLAGFLLLSRRLWLPAGIPATAIALVSVPMLLVSYSSTPEWHLIAATHAWFQPKQFTLPNGRMAVWEKSPLINADLISKQGLWAKPGTKPKNLIFLYIESGGLGLMQSTRVPGLMPNMHRLVKQHGFLPFIWASSYVTIEGEANTQCGTLLPFEHDNDSMAGFDNMVEQMPCLGDVLHAAGYQQSYLGGAGKSFAGKGRFLSAHGYDKVMGVYDWAKLGLKQRPGTWGLSDVDLFQQSLKELKRLKTSGKPYNLTMLTIGTHLPGFPYKECKPWRDGSERFLNAVYCSDQLIGQWVHALKDGGWLDDDTVLVITGDHNFFPNALMKRLFGEQAVQHRVLPLVVIGHDLPKPVQRQGAGFDIAPTIVDLLGVKTNARFAMGRSLLKDGRPIEYFPSRYVDIYNDKPWDFSDPFDCNPRNTSRIPGMQALSKCERQELSTILRMQARAYSAPLVQMRCNSARPIYVSIPDDADQPMDVRISGQQQIGRFTWAQRHIARRKPGLYLLALDHAGKLLWRKYVPTDQVDEKLDASPNLDRATSLIVAWRPAAKPTEQLPTWLLKAGADNHRGAWIFNVGATGSLSLAARSDTSGAVAIDSHTCTRLLGENH